MALVDSTPQTPPYTAAYWLSGKVVDMTDTRLAYDEAVFLTAVHHALGSGEFTVAGALATVPADQLPLHVRRELAVPSNPPKNPSRLLGRWLAYRNGVTWSEQRLVKTRKVNNVQRWKIESPVQP